MANSGIDLLAVQCGAVTAPAGCGKTHLIAEALSRHSSGKPILVLTHTNAGVAALRQRLIRAKVPASAYRLLTIDGWSMRLIAMFPKRSGLDPDLLRLRNQRADYPKIREVACELLKAGHINDILTSSYARVIVDEYQDCSIRQHALITSMAQSLPTCVLGDPLQAIFDFGGDGLAEWSKQVCAVFPVVGELDTPWRWINANSEPLGQWLLNVRHHLLNSKSIDLRNAPPSVSWVELDGLEDHQRRLKAALIRPPNNGGCVLIIGDSVYPRGQQAFASQTPGACTVEAVDIRDLVDFAQNFDLVATDSVDKLVHFAQSVMTNVGAAGLVQRIRSLVSGTARNPPTEVENVALAFARDPSYRGAADLLSAISRSKGVRAYRPTVLSTCVKALQLCSSSDLHFADAVVRKREEYRHVGRQLPKRGVGSTLLLKGLEVDVVVILNANALNAKNLYVALTRASRMLVVCSKTPVLNPNR